MQVLRVLILVALLVFVEMYKTKAQIPAKGADFPTLAGLHWGMTMQVAGDYLRGKVEVKNVDSSILFFNDKLFDIELDVKLKFVEKDSLLILNSIVAYLKEPDEDVLQSIETKFINRYGNTYECKKDPGTDDEIDDEKKLWRLNNENVELTVATHQKDILGLSITYKSTKLKRNLPIDLIPLKGSDFPTLAVLQWGMTMQVARNSISGKREILKTTSSTIIYEDTLLNTKARILLKFDDSNSLLILNAIEVKLVDPNRELLRSLEKRMIASYGGRYESKKESIAKFFFTFDFEAKSWQLGNENIALESLSHGDDVKGLKLMYKYNDAKR